MTSSIKAIEWQPIIGCSPISVGCANCYTAKKALADAGAAGLTTMRGEQPIWNGHLRFNEHALLLPTVLSDHHLIFVCAHGDLFHENAPREWVDAVFGVMEQCPRHIFQILTKRADRMTEYVNARYLEGAPANFQFGVSAERQPEADSRVAHLLRLRAPVRYVTFFPLLGPIDPSPFLDEGKLSFVIVGEERERPANPEWANKIESACVAHGVRYAFGKRLN